MKEQGQSAEIERLIQLLARLPGMGPRSARRGALFLIKKKADVMLPLASAMQAAAEAIRECPTCGNVDTVSPCTICADPRRETGLLCIVEEVGDVWALERAGVIKGRYHVLGGTLSPLDGVGPEELNLASLLERVRGGTITEVLIALNATVEGQSTAHYLYDQFQNLDLKISRLAQGVPVGGELDYLDEGTLIAAIKARKEM